MGQRYPGDLTPAAREVIAPLKPTAQRAGNERTVVAMEACASAPSLGPGDGRSWPQALDEDVVQVAHFAVH